MSLVQKDIVTLTVKTAILYMTHMYFCSLDFILGFEQPGWRKIEKIRQTHKMGTGSSAKDFESRRAAGIKKHLGSHIELL